MATIKKIIFSLMLLSSVCLYGQMDLSSPFVSKIAQASLDNPASLSPYKFSFSLPSVYTGFYNKGFKATDFIDISDEAITVNFQDLKSLVQNSGLEFNAGFRAETFGLTCRIKNLSLQLHHGIRSNNQVFIPQETLEFLLEGNGAHVGETINIGAQANSMLWSEIGLGFGLEVKSDFLPGKLTLGARIKTLSGITAIQTASSKMNVYTDPEYYQLTFESDYRINTAGLNSEASNGGGFSDYLFSQNKGLAFDIGATYQLGDKLQLGLSINDIGSITWNNNLNSYTSQGTYEFEGYDLAPLLEEESSLDFEQVLDTLEQIFKFEESQESFQTNLPTTLQMSGSYAIKNNLRAGLVYKYLQNFNEAQHAIGINITRDFGSIFSLGLQYNTINADVHSLGLQSVLKLGPVQVFFLTDNVVPLFDPLNAQFFNARVGMNLVFGKVD